MNLTAWDRRVAALTQLHVADPANPVLSKDDRHHLVKVLRANEGEEIVVTDGAGRWALCAFRNGELVHVLEPDIDSRPALTELYVAPLKGDRSELVIAKAVELGVSRVVPLVSERLAVKFKGDAREKALERWRRIAREAAGQCRRTYDLEIADPVEVADVPAHVAVCDFGGSTDWNGVTAVAIGPEGGFAPDEWPAGRTTLSLGPQVLRAETAAITAAGFIGIGSGNWQLSVRGPAVG